MLMERFLVRSLILFEERWTSTWLGCGHCSRESPFTTGVIESCSSSFDSSVPRKLPSLKLRVRLRQIEFMHPSIELYLYMKQWSMRPCTLHAVSRNPARNGGPLFAKASCSRLLVRICRLPTPLNSNATLGEMHVWFGAQRKAALCMRTASFVQGWHVRGGDCLLSTLGATWMSRRHLVELQSCLGSIV